VETGRSGAPSSAASAALASALLATLVLASPLRAAPQVEPCVVVDVIDAATLRLACAGRERTVRLPAVRAPRPGAPQQGGEPFSGESLALAAGLLRAQPVVAVAGVVLYEGEDLRRQLLALGLVQLADIPSFHGAGAELRAAEREARAARRGLWSLAAWRRHQALATRPTELIAPTPRVEEPLAARAARMTRLSWEQRKAAFDAAMAELERVSQGGG
jgi:endonuclease YncB( thermonuclease family)